MPVALIVEDNPLNRKLLRDILEIEFSVLQAESAEMATAMLASTKPDIIFLDMQLPGASGAVFAAQVKQSHSTSSIPIVAISAHAMQDAIDQALAAGCIEYITKPITEDPLDFVERMAKLARGDNHTPV